MFHDMVFTGKTILLVDDDLCVLDQVEAQLCALGVKRVLTATTLGDARDWIAEDVISLALLDVNLQHGETTVDLGWDLARNGLPVVFFSGFNYEAMSRLTRGFELLEKPVSLPRLKAAILRAILRAPHMGDYPTAKKMAGREARQ